MTTPDMIAASHRTETFTSATFLEARARADEAIDETPGTVVSTRTRRSRDGHEITIVWRMG